MPLERHELCLSYLRVLRKQVNGAQTVQEGKAMQDEQQQNVDYIGISADIVSAFVSNNNVQAGDLPALIGNVHDAVKTLGEGGTKAAEAEKREPAVNPKRSVHKEYIISLFDGRRYKSLKRHLRSSHNMTPEQYRAYWDLSPSYPMVAPAYSARRSELAKSVGLGLIRKGAGKAAKKPSGKAAKGRKKAAA
jgi:predicted transcriptional regulator